MNSVQPSITLRTVPSIHEVAAGVWDSLANPDPATRNPFLSHAFLSALEDSGSAVSETGWQALHLILECGNDILGAAPLYVKSHSQGEYVFDHSWAHALERAGGAYYPKLLCAVPFTPASGPRLLVGAGPQADHHRILLARGMEQMMERLEVSSLHINFLTKREWQALGTQNYLQRTDQQFHWLNKGYQTFDDFLSDLSSRKRKQIKKERREALANGIEVKILRGNTLTETALDAFYGFYMDTGMRKWGSPYLTRTFFSLMRDRMADDVALVMCYREDRAIAGALNFVGGDTLYGRNWGALEHHKFLHFEACYYQAIEFAIENGLKKVEAGAQGAHKLARGYVPCTTYSAHLIAHEGFREAVADFLEHERKAVQEEQSYLRAHAPFAKDRYSFESDDITPEDAGDF
ncbi:MAG: GNAT family N-acetyltransferase [Alphaproteobacteria bacterium]